MNKLNFTYNNINYICNYDFIDSITHCKIYNNNALVYDFNYEYLKNCAYVDNIKKGNMHDCASIAKYLHENYLIKLWEE